MTESSASDRKSTLMMADGGPNS